MATRTRRRAPVRTPEVRRDEIVDAAVRVFARTPYRAARTADVAAVAGIAEGTIFRHFDSKRALYLATLERVLASVREQYRTIADTTPDAVTAVRAMASCSQEHATADADELRLRQRAVAESDDADVRALLLQGYQQVQQIVAEVMRRGQQQGVMDTDANADAAAWLFMAGGLLIESFGLLGVGPEERLALCRELGVLQRRGLGVDPV
jgi:AcrR family transcriptional regulator